MPIKLELVTLWQRQSIEEAENCSARIEFLAPDQTSLLSYDLPVKFESGKKRYRFRAKFNGLRVTVAGQYQFRLSLQDSSGRSWLEVARIPLDIDIVKKPKPTPQAGV